MRKYWIGVVSKKHVQDGVKLGIAQVCHGKRGPLSKMKQNDVLIYYSPKLSMEFKEPCQCFTAIGKVKTGNTYQVEMSPSFKPYRLDINYYACKEIPIKSLLDQLEFTKYNRNWGYKLRFGLFEISEHDFRCIAKSMEASIETTTV